jgi:MFS family permease
MDELAELGGGRRAVDPAVALCELRVAVVRAEHDLERPAAPHEAGEVLGGREPLVSQDLFRIRSYVLGAPVGLLYFAGFVAMFFTLTQYLQLGLGYPAWKSGLAATPFAIGGALVASVGSRQALRRGPKLVAFGLATFLVGMVGVWLAVGAHPGHDVALWTALPLMVAGLGGGLVISPNLTLTLSQVPLERAGSAGGLLQTGQRIGSAVGIAITGMVFYSQLASSHGDYASAFQHGIIVIAAFVAATLALVLAAVFTRDSERP